MYRFICKADGSTKTDIGYLLIWVHSLWQNVLWLLVFIGSVYILDLLEYRVSVKNDISPSPIVHICSL